MQHNSAAFRNDFFHDRDHVEKHDINSCHNYFGMSEYQYLLTEEKAYTLMEMMKKKYYLLKLANRDKHGYDNIYMDTKNYDLYKQEKSSLYDFSVRTRAYDRHDTVYFQIKHKNKDRSTVYSYEYKEAITNQLTPEMWHYYCGIFEALTGKQPTKLIFPALQISYDRYIFYHRKHDERVDIDFNIRFIDLRNPKKPIYTLDNIAIVESKSSRKKTYLHKLLTKLDAKKCPGGLYPIAMHYIDHPSQDKEVAQTVKKILSLQNT